MEQAAGSPPPPSAPPSDQYNNLYPTLPKDVSSNNSLACSKHSQAVPPPDVVDNEPEPSAPPLEFLDKVTGYENASFSAVEIPPPLVPSILEEGLETERAPLPSGPQISEIEARHALLRYASSHCCYGKGAARDMAILKIDHSCAFHYTLETFTEKRQTAWTFEPYTGGIVDGPSAGPAPGPWEMSVPAPTPFQNQASQHEVPHTASIKLCHTCGGVGRKRCFTCSGNGWEYCMSCHGDGQKSAMQGSVDRCFQCHGTGRKRCWKCNGDGMAVCRACSGTGQIKCFIQLAVSWTNHVDDHVVERSALPDHKVKRVGGQVVFEEERPWVWPISHFPDNTINIASAQLVQKHASAFPMEKSILQKHCVRIIPVATVFYQYHEQQGTYFVYGFENKVYAPDYPHTCFCCACAIL